MHVGEAGHYKLSSDQLRAASLRLVETPSRDFAHFRLSGMST